MAKVLPYLAASLLLHALPFAVPAPELTLSVAALTPLELDTPTWTLAPEPSGATAALKETDAAAQGSSVPREAVPGEVESRELAPAPVRRVPRALLASKPAAEQPEPSAPDTAEPDAPAVLAQAAPASEPGQAFAVQSATQALAEPASQPAAGAPAAALGVAASGSSAGSSAAPSSSARVGANAGGGSADVAAARAQYLQRLRQRVIERRQYPHAALRAGLEGTVCLRVSLDAAGRISELRPTCGPLPAPLLQAALRAVRAAEPFGPLPSGVGQTLSVDLPVVFTLDAQ
jgi:periplasmic protein TonB